MRDPNDVSQQNYREDNGNRVSKGNERENTTSGKEPRGQKK